MQIRVYIESGGNVILTALVAGLLPVAHALDQTDRQVQGWIEALPEVDESERLEPGQRGSNPRNSKSLHETLDVLSLEGDRSC